MRIPRSVKFYEHFVATILVRLREFARTHHVSTRAVCFSLVISFRDNYRNAWNIHIKHARYRDMIGKYGHAYHEVTLSSRKKNRPGGGSPIAV
jgi:hypothetical protein